MQFQGQTVAYIDGYNLYYGLLKGTPYKWFDSVRLVKALLRDGHDLISVKYFTSPVKTYPHDAAALDRQKVYIQALTTFPNVEIIQGFYRKDAVLMPVHEAECKVCPTARDGLIKVVKLEEKRTDVNIASAMLLDAFNDKADVFVLMSGDTDFIAPVSIVRRDFKKTVIVLIQGKASHGFMTMLLITSIFPVTFPAAVNCPTPSHTESVVTASSIVRPRGNNAPLCRDSREPRSPPLQA